MDQKRLNKPILDKIFRYKGLNQFAKQIKEDLEIMAIKDNDCLHRASFRKKIYIETLEKGNKNISPKIKVEWDAKIRQEQEERIKEYWANRKKT